MARGADGPDFGARDARVLAHVTTIIADGIRASLRHDAGRRAASDGPGLVVLGPADEVELITPPARALLSALRSATLRETDETPPRHCSRWPHSRAPDTARRWNRSPCPAHWA